MIAHGRFLDLYSGLSAGLLRQAIYATSRMGLFETFMQLLTSRAEEKTTLRGVPTEVTFLQRSMAGIAAGGMGALLGNPADLALVRMQTDKMASPENRANYSSVFNALRRIVAAEGVFALWKGWLPTVTRAMAVNFGQLTFFSESKRQLQKTTLVSGIGVPLAASAIAGFFASFFSLPFDFIKTQLQRQTRGPDGSLRYKGSIDCAAQVFRQEGISRFYRGFGTYYTRAAPHSMITLLLTDYVRFLVT